MTAKLIPSATPPPPSFPAPESLESASVTVPPTATPSHSRANFEREIRRFAESIDSLLMSLPNVMAAMQHSVSEQGIAFVTFLQASGTQQIVSGNKIRFTLSGEPASKAIKMERSLKNNGLAYRLIHRSFLTSLISQYDAYLGRLLRLVYFVRPEKLNTSEKQITFKDLVQFSSLEEARERLIEREVDSVVRRSHEDQFVWLKENLSLPAATFIPELPIFIEIAQRRHLFVHCDGVVSAPYIKNCAAAGVKLDPTITVGQQLEVTKDYLETAFERVYAVGVKTGFALWLNLFKADVNEAATCINYLAFDLISNQRYSLAINLLEYARSGRPKPLNEQLSRFIVLNLAQSYRWSGDEVQSAKVLDGYDWSACSNVIKLGVAVLRNQYEEALRLVRTLANDDEFKKESYREWPIFREFRKKSEFLRCYKEIYAEEYEVAQVEANLPKSSSSTPMELEDSGLGESSNVLQPLEPQQT